VESKIGLDASTLDLEWYLRPVDVMSPNSQLAILQAFERGVWDNGMVRLWRAVMPQNNPGDCNTFGACELFAGRIAEQTMTRTGVQIKVNCPLELLDQQLPSNLIEPGNPQAQYGTGQPPAGLSTAPTFTIGAGSTAAVLLADCTLPSGRLFAADVFDFGYVQFTSGTGMGLFATIRRSDVYQGRNRFALYEPLPFTPALGDALTAYVPFARNSSGSGYQGFPYVPSPEAST
jgi:hypothetical protein